MDLSVDEFIKGLLEPHTVDLPSDSKRPDLDRTQLPEWFDEKKFNRARKFFWSYSFSFATSMLYGLVAVFSIPSILRVLVASQRSSSVYTSYRRYLSTLLHTIAWFDHELKPGSVSWRSLHEVRSRHYRAGLAAKAKDLGTVSQRDIALTQYGFVGFSILKPRSIGIQQLEPGDWDAYVHFWRVIGYMIGLEDRYNICRSTYEETREVCQILQERVFTPAMTSVPEYFEHMARVMLDGLWSVNPTSDIEAVIFHAKYLSDVPGYVFYEEERIQLQKTIREKLKGTSIHSGVEITSLVSKPAIEGVPEQNTKLLYYSDYDVLSEIPAYKQLSSYSKYKLTLNMWLLQLSTNFWGRWYLNLNHWYALFLSKYFPYLSFFRFGIKQSYVNLFVESVKDDTKPLPNAEYYKLKKEDPWYKTLFMFIFNMFGLAT